MSVYVDLTRRIQKTKKWIYGSGCHMWADNDSELELMARKLKLSKKWKHNDYYDLTSRVRRRAIRFGAVEVNIRSLIQERIENRN